MFVFGDRIVNLQDYVLGVALAGVVFLWLLLEYFICKWRMVAPVIVLLVMFVVNAVFGFVVVMSELFMIVQGDYISVLFLLFFVIFALVAYWWRFCVLFVMVMIAVGLFVVVIIFDASRGGRIVGISDLFLLLVGGPFAWIMLALGLIVFVVVMAFDMSDLYRVMCWSANGFWLYVVVVSVMVNTVVLFLLDQDFAGFNIILVVVLMLFVIVVIVIDCWSFLIVVIGYIVVLAGIVFDGDGAVLIVLVLGLVLLLLGAFWEWICVCILRLMLGFVLLHKLPSFYSQGLT